MCYPERGRGLNLIHFIIFASFVKKCTTPKGDENPPSLILIQSPILGYVKKCITPKGDENPATATTTIPTIALRTVLPREGTRTLRSHCPL